MGNTPRITRIETRALALLYKDWYSGEIPEHVLWPIPHAQVTPRDGAYGTLVYVYDDAGHVGIGEAGSTMAPQVTAEIVNRLFAPVLIGQNPLDREVLWQKLYHIGRLNGQNRGFNMEALSGVDIALWDLAARILDVPVYQLLGGAFRHAIKTYASPIPIMGDDAAAIQLALRFVSDGFTGIKIKVGRPDLVRDVRLVKSIRAAVGDDIDLMLDANGAYDMFTALTLARRLQDSNILWFEEPFSSEDLDAYVALKRNVAIPLAAGEGEATSYNYAPWIDRRAVDVLQPNISRVGGLTAARRIAAMADAHHIPLSPHGVGGAVFLTATLHLCAAIPNFVSVEYNQRPNPLRDQLATAPLAFANGCLQVPEGPGLGVVLNDVLVEKLTIR